MRKFAAFDIDGTLIRWQLYHATADRLVSLGHIDEEEFEPIRAARMAWKNREQGGSFKEYERQLVELYGRIITSLTVGQVNDAIDGVFETYKDQVSTYTRDLIAKLKDEKYLLFAISGSQAEIIAKLAQYYGFDDYVGSIYVNDGQHFSGETILPLGRKDKVLDGLIQKHHASRIGSIAVGDSAGDIPMLEMVETPIAFNPEQKLAEHAEQKGWTIVLERKNQAWKLQNGKYELVKANI